MSEHLPEPAAPEDLPVALRLAALGKPTLVTVLVGANDMFPPSHRVGRPTVHAGRRGHAEAGRPTVVTGGQKWYWTALRPASQGRTCSAITARWTGSCAYR